MGHNRDCPSLQFRLRKALSWSALALTLLPIWSFPEAPPVAEEDTCLLFSDECLARGKGNFRVYQRFSDKRVGLKPGDTLEYDIFIDRASPTPEGGLDLRMRQSGTLRDADQKSITDDRGLSVHPGARLEPAYGRWYHRRIPLDRVADKSSSEWSVAFEGDEPGRYTLFLDNVVVRRATGSVVQVYSGGPAPSVADPVTNGYSVHRVLLPVSRARVQEGADLRPLIAEAVDSQRRDEALGGWVAQVGLLERMMRDAGESSAAQREAIARAKTVLDAARRPSATAPATTETLAATAAQLAEALAPLQPLAGALTGHLIGHAHIDFQWKWPWDETVEATRKTFVQALKFMDEYPGFTFSQSSTALYMAIEKRFPDLFEAIRRRVEEGRWELVGGRVSEGDTNVVSAESHARQFLYGQRYFRERFGRVALTGWEPDTFGSCATMPAILASGGCSNYFFSRGGEHRMPVFWWEAPDGVSRVLAFDRSATAGAHPVNHLTGEQLEAIVVFHETTGWKDVLLAYGVGDQGGGPTRECLETALEWQRRPALPAVRFSTAAAFFSEGLRRAGEAKTPVYRGELNDTIDGAYSAHGDVKRGNRDGEAWTETAEALAAIAARYGFPYPGLEFRCNWEDLAWNAHHDTLAGSSIHSVYEKSRRMYDRVIESGRKIANDALGFLGGRVNAPAGATLVFNPVGWPRDAVVECAAPAAGAGASGAVAVAAGQASAPIQIIDATVGRAVFVARALPPYGYRCYEFKPGPSAPAPTVTVSKDGTRLENDRLRVVLDPAGGTVKSLIVKRTGREIAPEGGSLNRLEFDMATQPDGAWHFGKVLSVEPQLGQVDLRVRESGPARGVVEFTRQVRKSRITQRISLAAGSPAVDFEIAIDWKELGKNLAPSPMMRIAMDADFNTTPVATYEIPFGSIKRPLSEHELVALKWADLSDGRFGISLLNDCKHGHTAEGRTLRMTLIRSSAFPDPEPDQYLQTVRYTLYPHEGGWKDAETVALAAALNHPVVTHVVSPVVTRVMEGGGGPRDLPVEISFVGAGAPNVAITGVKRAEDDDDLVVRFYETNGAATRTGIATAWLVEGAARVNFLEDPLGPVGPLGAASATAMGAESDLRGHEIQTLKLRLKAVPGVSMAGTRGPEPPRDF